MSIIPATCYKCGKDYEEDVPNNAVAAKLDHFDPTDWECPDCLEAEDDAYDDYEKDIAVQLAAVTAVAHEDDGYVDCN